LACRTTMPDMFRLQC